MVYVYVIESSEHEASQLKNTLYGWKSIYAPATPILISLVKEKYLNLTGHTTLT